MPHKTSPIDRTAYTSSKFEKHAAFWKDFMSKTQGDNFHFVQNHLTDEDEKDFRKYEYRIEGDVFHTLADTGQNAEAGMFMVLLSALSLLFRKYTGEGDNIIIATPGFQGGDQAVPIHCRVSDGLTIREHLRYLQETIRNTYEVQDYPFELVDGWDSGTIPTNIFMENEKIHASYEDKSQFDLLIKMDVSEESVVLFFSYNQIAFDPDFIARFAQHLENVIGHFDDRNKKMKQISPFSESELDELLERAKGPVNKVSGDIVSTYRQQVEKNPDATALIFRDRVLSYQELYDTASRIASYLMDEAQTDTEEIVAVMLGRSEKIVQSILGVLMSGAAFLPIDPDLPEERKAFMLKEAGCRTLITESEHMFDIPSFEGQILALDIQLDTFPEGELKKIDIEDSQTAYIMYTSGSSGTPKGVVIEHQSVVNLAMDQRKLLGINSGDRVLQFAPFTFDASIWEIFNALLSGAGLVVADDEMVRSPDLLITYTREKNVTIAGLSASFYNALDPEELTHLRVIMTGGERPNLEKSLITVQHSGRYNAYGPTECTVNSTVYQITPDDRGKKVVPVGKPISNMSVYIFNAAGELAPDGFIGEIYVAGKGLARGYLKNSEMTEGKFIANPYLPSEKMYKTGDLGRRLSDGDIEFVGRKDNQVKIRGYRVELEEVEHAILSNPGIEEAVVLAVDEPDGTFSLAAYLKQSESIDREQLKDFLSDILPSYMIPAYVVFPENFPLTANGKIDKQKLLTYDRLPTNTRSFVAPGTETEKQIAAIFSKILGKEKVSIRDNFFEMGGNSLKAIAVFKGIEEEFSGYLKITDLFVDSNIESIARAIDEKRSGPDEKTDKGYKRIKI